MSRTGPGAPGRQSVGFSTERWAHPPRRHMNWLDLWSLNPGLWNFDEGTNGNYERKTGSNMLPGSWVSSSSWMVSHRYLLVDWDHNGKGWGALTSVFCHGPDQNQFCPLILFALEQRILFVLISHKPLLTMLQFHSRNHGEIPLAAMWLGMA